MKWAEQSKGCWVSKAGLVAIDGDKLRCIVNEVGVIEVPDGTSVEDAQIAIEAEYAQHVARTTGSQDIDDQPAVARRGRKPKGDRPMTGAERQAASIKRLKRKATDGAGVVEHLGKAQQSEQWDRRRVTIHEWLERQAPPLALVYKGTVEVLHLPASGARSYFVAHGIREIANRLPDFLEKISSDKVIYEKHVGPISKLWQQERLPVGDGPFPVLLNQDQEPGKELVPISTELAKMIAALLGDHAAGEARNQHRNTALFNALKQQVGIATSGALPAVEQWNAVRDWGRRNAHVGLKGPRCDYEEVCKRFATFERILYALIGQFVDILGQMDELLAAGPTPENAGLVIELLSRGGARNYFFDRVSDPGWLQVLDDKKYFKAVVEGEHWPESTFLKRVAGQDPKRVVEILDGLTKKPGLIASFYLIDIIFELPPEEGARLIGVLKAQAADAIHSRHFAFNLPRLIVRFAEAGKREAAIGLFDAMYSARVTKEADGSVTLSYSDTSNDLWLLQEGLKTIQPALLKLDAKTLIHALCSKLKQAVIADGLIRDGFDNSYFIGGRIAASENNWPSDYIYDAATMFGKATILAAKAAIDEGYLTAEEALALVERGTEKIFKFVSFSLLALIGPKAAEEAIAIMVNPLEYDESPLHDSYGNLLRARFSELSPDQQGALLGWIRKGPELARVIDRWKAVHDGAEPTAEKWEIYRKGWIRSWLELIPSEHLPEVDAAMLKQYKIDLAPEIRRMAIFEVEASPKSKEELEAMTPAEIADWLKKNAPREGQGPDMELSTLLPQVIQARPIEFSAAARDFIGVHQSWVRNFLFGLTNMNQQSPVLEWPPLLDLCSWIVQQPRGEEPVGRYRGADVSWEGARSAVADLLRHGLFKTEPAIPAETAQVIWSILEELADDPDPTPEYEKEHPQDPAIMSLNTVRGKAMHGVVQYAMWRRRNMAEDDAARGMAAMPEVQVLLDQHLDFEIEPSPAIRSVYAQYFPALAFLDAEWATAARLQIFPESEADLRYWRASWSVYATFAGAYDKAFEILRPTYELAIDRMPWTENPDGPRRSNGEDWRHAEENTVSHLVAFYWRGKIGIEEDGLLARFMARCTPRSRGRAMWFAASSLARTKEDVPREILDRLMRLWNWRMQAVRTLNGPDDRDELSAFGGWFAYGKLDVKWSLQNLIEVLKLTTNIDHPSMVIGRLAAMAETDLDGAIRGLEAFLDADREGWRHTTAREDILKLLAAALVSDEGDVEKAARGIIHTLAERGDLTYRGLLGDPEDGAAA